MRFAWLSSFIVVLAASASAQSPGSKREHFNYGSWETQVMFAQGVSGRNPGRIIYMAGVGAEEDSLRGGVHHPGDFLAQCRYAYNEIKKRLEKQGARMQDIVHTVTYVTDVRFFIPNRDSRKEAFGNGPYPAQTFLVISALARPGMLVEIEARAVTD
jgi:enamine deaminase RidA (YjgF/YER057c/UK114 family)